MELTRDAKVVAGIILLTVPTVQYGGLAILGMLTHGLAGTGGSGSGSQCGTVGFVSCRSRACGCLAIVVVGPASSARCREIADVDAMVGADLGTGGYVGIERRLFWHGIYT